MTDDTSVQTIRLHAEFRSVTPVCVGVINTYDVYQSPTGLRRCVVG